MPLWGWTLLYLVNAGFWLWVLAFGGAQRLEGTFLASLLIRLRASSWDAETIKAVALVCLIGSTFWFVAGLIEPGIRFR